jgi:uncharacterized protein YacL
VARPWLELNDLGRADPLRIVIRMILVALGAWVAYLIAPHLVTDGVNQIYIVILGALITSLFTGRPSLWLRRVVARLAEAVVHLEPQTVFAATVATIGALLVSVLLNSVLSNIPGYAWYVQLIITAILEVFLVSIAVLNAPMLRNLTGGIVSERSPSRVSQGAISTVPKLLDTSVIIDGRILEVARTGFLEGTLIVPGFVLRELQFFADQSDSARRNKGRRGLEVLETLRAMHGIELSVREFEDTGGGVDDRLIRAAQSIGGSVVTNDSGLARVAGLQDVKALSFNSLADALKTRFGAGDEFDLVVVKEGSQAGQGIGYLEDGTMVVIEDGVAFKGRTVRIQVSTVTQTSLGRMIFAKPKEVVP